MSRILLLALLSVCGASANAASKTTEWQPTNVQWHMSLDATGHITALGAEGAAVDALREKLEPVVRAWTFVPGAVNGKPAATETMLSVQVAFDSIAGTDDLSVRVVDVRTGGGLSPVGSKMPRFPRDALRRMMSGRNSPVERVVLSISSILSVSQVSASLVRWLRRCAFTSQPPNPKPNGIPGGATGAFRIPRRSSSRVKA